MRGGRLQDAVFLFQREHLFCRPLAQFIEMLDGARGVFGCIDSEQQGRAGEAFQFAVGVRLLRELVFRRTATPISAAA